MLLDAIHHKGLLLMLFVTLNDVADLSDTTTQTSTQGNTLFTLSTSSHHHSTTKKPCSEPCSKPCVNVTQSNKGLVAFPDCLPVELENLDLSHNNLSEIKDQDISHLSQLRGLVLRNNQISEISWTSNVLPSLEFLDLSYNNFFAVPRCVMLKRVKLLSLAHNPILEIQPYAFACFPNVEILNLSHTPLWTNSSEAISRSAFALNATHSHKTSLTSLQTLDLSWTNLTRVNEEWSKDLPNLKDLRLRDMPIMKTLDGLGEAFPQLERLNCENSSSLSSISDAMFDRTLKLNYINFQNCNLTSVSPWNITSGFLEIDLRGNPLVCNCELSWLLSTPANLTLIRSNETFCHDDRRDKHVLTDYFNTKCHLNTQSHQLNGTTEANENTAGSATSTETNPIHFQSTPKRSLENTSTLPEKANNLSIVTVFKTTSTDSTLTATIAKLLLATYDTNTQSSAESTSRTRRTNQVITGLHTLTVATIPGSTAGEERATNSPGPSLTKLPDGAISSMSAEPTNQQATYLSTQKNIKKTGASNSNPKDATSSPGIFLDYANEYDNEDDEPYTTVTNEVIPCNYNPCRHHQTPCFQLQHVTQCLCPGLSGENIVPDPPVLGDVDQVTDTSAQVHWCAPNSVVQTYQLVYSPAVDTDKTVIDNVHDTTRQYTLYNLLPDTTYRLCAVSVNRAGLSEAKHDALPGSSCTEFKTKPSFIIVMAVLSALCGLFLAVTTVLSVCLYRMHRNNMVNQYDTHLVSYKNPTFDYQLTIPSYS